MPSSVRQYRTPLRINGIGSLRSRMRTELAVAGSALEREVADHAVETIACWFGHVLWFRATAAT